MKLSRRLALIAVLLLLVIAGVWWGASMAARGAFTLPRFGMPAGSAMSTATWVSGSYGLRYAETDNTRYLFGQADEYSSHPVGVLLKERVVTRLDSGDECCRIRITVEGRPDSGSNWSLQRDEPVIKGELFGPFYRTTEGCCASPIRDFYFDLKTGKQRFSATIPLAELSVSQPVGRFTRYFAVDEFETEGSPAFVAKVQYGDGQSPSQVMYLTGDHFDNSAGTKTHVDFLQNGQLTPSATSSPHSGAFGRVFQVIPPGDAGDKAATPQMLTGFSFVLTVEDDLKITIPIEADRPVFEKARLPPGFAFTASAPQNVHD